MASKETRAGLVDAAAHLIAEVGWGAVSARLVARKAGVSLGTVHYHFASVDELVREAAIANTGALFEQMSTAFFAGSAAAPTPGEGIERLTGFLDSLSPDSREVIILYEALVAARRDESLRAAEAAAVLSFRSRLTEWLETQGVPEAAGKAAVIAAAVDGFLVQRGLEPELSTATLRQGLLVLVS